MADVTIKPQTYQYPELISKIEQGLIKVPAFQREFVWPMDKTLFLLDSIARRYPIGTFLFWQSSDFVNSLRNIGDLDLAQAPSGYPVQYVLDGQQRITSLYAALRSAQINGQAYRIVADLDSTAASEEIFFASEPDHEALVLLSDLLGDDYGALFAELTPARQRRFNLIRNTFLNYPFSVTLVEGGDLDIVCDLFERINNTGVELSVFDLLVARTWSPPEEQGGFDLRASYDELCAELAEVGFDEIPEPVVAQLAGALVKHECTRKAILSITRAEMREQWPPLAESMRSAVDYVRKKMGINASRLLPYPSLLVAIGYFFARNDMRNPDGDQSSWLSRYFYLNGFANRLSSGTQSKLTEDLHHLDALVDGKALPVDISVAITPEGIRDTNLRIGNAYCKSVLCLLAAQHPKDLRDGSAILLSNRALKQANSRHFHHVFPKAYLRGKVGVENANSIANVSLVPADLNLKIGSKAPSAYLSRFSAQNPNWSDCLESHLIHGKALDAIENDDFVAFIAHRSELLSELAHRAVGIPAARNAPA